jgi:phosphoethanolamine N-methyltransferase
MPRVTSTFLDTQQYASEEIRKYEAIYGQHFVSPGGEATARECVAMLELVAGDRVLDIGCGLGGSAFLMAREQGARVHGLDLSRNMIASAEDRCAREGLRDRVSFEHGDCLELHRPSSVEAVYSRDVFLHVHDKQRLFGVIHETLVPGGRLLFTDYCRAEGEASVEFEEYVTERGYSLLSVAMYVEHLKLAGFTQVRGMDWTDRFIDIHHRELERLPEAGLPDKDTTELEQGWRAKIARARNGEQRWGCFSARKPASP